jgi:hypothetical protein
MRKEDRDDDSILAEAAARLREGRQALSMTLYAIQHGRRTPDQVRAVLDRSSRAIRRNQIVRSRWTQLLAVH